MNAPFSYGRIALKDKYRNLITNKITSPIATILRKTLYLSPHYI